MDPIQNAMFGNKALDRLVCLLVAEGSAQYDVPVTVGYVSPGCSDRATGINPVSENRRWHKVIDSALAPSWRRP